MEMGYRKGLKRESFQTCRDPETRWSANNKDGWEGASTQQWLLAPSLLDYDAHRQNVGIFISDLLTQRLTIPRSLDLNVAQNERH
jgi:hypothetical protein